MTRIFLCAGEASGDAYAFAIAQRLREAAPDVQLEGVGGAKLLSLIGKLVDNSSAYGAIGIYESIRVAHKVYGGLRKAKKNLRLGTPGVFIPIDFGFINIQLARYAKKLGWRVIYFVPPGSWRRTKQGADLPAITDAIITPFSWSADILRGMGANVFWEGHPLKQLIGSVPSPENRESVAILPGSRLHEIQFNLEVIGESLAGFDGTVEIAVANRRPLNPLFASAPASSCTAFPK
ncbi:MAG: hypothetical protein K8R88_05155 [Armatimonadetes bacterium]|nr:hypothetical protein [Armatimonadota bacterium]